MEYIVIALSLFVLINARPDVSQIPSGGYLPSLGGNLGGPLGNIGGIGIGGVGGTGGVGQVGGTQQDQKHVYFFAAPDEQEVSRLRINIAPSSQKNTKIIFVKAPSYGSVVPEVIAPPSISEDKTLVYVLVKRPDQGGQITIPAGSGVKQAKPEVYFIKYKSQQDAQAAISGGLNGQNVGSTVPELGNESSFVTALQSAVSNQGLGGLDGNFGGNFGNLGGNFGGTINGGGQYGPPGVSGPY